ncbi:hypothetical protein F4805DRAFT_478720 [Annulohypoxylon moriforme]|nr:hypothetical protein F4805DRAFT_478720 [Annulohypoxylon moriforme]
MDEANSETSHVAQVAIWFLFITSILVGAARLGTRYAMTSTLAWDDRIMILSMVAYLSQCIAASEMASNGLGQSLSSLSEVSIDQFLKAGYANIPLLILTLALVKWSNLAFIKQLSTRTFDHRTNFGLGLLVGLWFLSGIIVSLFQSPMPSPWAYNNDDGSIDRRAWWTFLSVMNMLTDVGIIATYCSLMARLQISLIKRGILFGIFLTRILVIVATGGQLAAFWVAYGDPDISRSERVPVICNQAVVCLSVISSCLPYLRPFMESLQSGVGRIENIGSEDELADSRPTPQSNTYCMNGLADNF